jgi:hypothetical protein
MGELLELADRLATVDGFVPRALINKPPSILATLMAGAEIGLGPMVSLRAIHIIEGRVALSAEIARALVLAAGHELLVDGDDNQATARGRRADSAHWTTVEWTMDRARRAGLASKQVWRNYPRQMLTARASGELCHLAFPDVLAGLEVFEAIEVEPEEPDAPPRRNRMKARATVPPPPLEPPTYGTGHLPDEPPEAAADVDAEAPPEPREAPGGAPVDDAPPPPSTVASAPVPPQASAPPSEAGHSAAPPLPGEAVGPGPGAPPATPAPAQPPAEPVQLNQGAMLRRLHARMAETFPGLDRDTTDLFRHALVALVTRRREGGAVASSALLTEAEQMGFDGRLNDIAAGRALIVRTPRSTVELRQGGWLYEVSFDPLEVRTTQERQG